MAKELLLVAPRYMDLYKDVIEGLKSKGFHVDYIAEASYKEDPKNRRGYRRFSKIFVNADRFDKKMQKRWSDLLSTPPYNKRYDYLLVLDGQSLHPVLFKILRERNPDLYAVNYLFDSTGIYDFADYFPLFDSVFTFDTDDAAKYQLPVLPIYWVDQPGDSTQHYGVFGLGAVSQSRYEFFKKIQEVSSDLGLRTYLKLYVFFKIKYWSLYALRCWLYKRMGLNVISIAALRSEFATYDTLSPLEFRKMIVNSDIIIDSCASHQKGLTARFMWAAGLGKKIVTTNANVVNYDFYDKNQMYIWDDDADKTREFFLHHFGQSEDLKEKMEAFRLDHWLDTLLTR